MTFVLTYWCPFSPQDPAAGDDREGADMKVEDAEP